jgi:hypothetical protein
MVAFLTSFSSGSPRVLASVLHLSASCLVATLAAWVVFSLWFPYPYREASGGVELFGLIVTVDVLLGPLLTAIV